MVLECPKCGSDEVRLSKRRRALNRVLQLVGLYTFRCQGCHAVFRSQISNVSHFCFAKCPSCHRMDLSRWSREYYSPSTTTKVMLSLGAKPVRCEYCRNNFWSFLFVKEKFSREKRAARSRVRKPPAKALNESDPAITARR